MVYREAGELVKKYWAGETTPEEETALKDFFKSGPEDLDEELKQAAPLFIYFDRESSRVPGVIQMPWEQDAQKQTANARRRTASWPGRYWEYVALLALVLGSMWLMRPAASLRLPATARADTFQNPDKAWDATRKALKILASNLNKGKEQIKKIGVFSEAEKTIRNQR